MLARFAFAINTIYIEQL